MVLISLYRWQIGGKAPPPATTGKKNGAAGLFPDHLSLPYSYLLLTSALYKSIADMITITTPRKIKGCIPASYLIQTQAW